MKVTVAASAAYELGHVDPDWHSDELEPNVDIVMAAKSHDENGERNYSIYNLPEAEIKSLAQLGFGYLPPKSVVDLGEALMNPIVQIDNLVRKHRGYTDEDRTAISAVFRSGTKRYTSMLGILAANAIEYLPFKSVPIAPSTIHVDRFGTPKANSLEDIVLVCSGGTATEIFEGPVVDIHSSRESVSILGDLALLLVQPVSSLACRLTAPNSYLIPEDTAVLITDTTFHRQSPSIYGKDQPLASFLRVTVTKVT